MPLECNDQNPCTVDVCNDQGVCEYLPLSEGECTDNNACTEADKCKTGLCIGVPKNCDDSNPCTDGDGCVSGDCVPGQPLVCNDENPCTADTCDSTAGGCVFAPQTGTPCALSGTLCSKVSAWKDSA